MIMPDFIEWSKRLDDREDAAIALEQAFNQGLALGRRTKEQELEEAYERGFQDGDSLGWQLAQDKELEDIAKLNLVLREPDIEEEE